MQNAYIEMVFLAVSSQFVFLTCFLQDAVVDVREAATGDSHVSLLMASTGGIHSEQYVASGKTEGGIRHSILMIER